MECISIDSNNHSVFLFPTKMSFHFVGYLVIHPLSRCILFKQTNNNLNEANQISETHYEGNRSDNNCLISLISARRELMAVDGEWLSAR